MNPHNTHGHVGDVGGYNLCCMVCSQQQVKSFTSTQSELMERNKSLQVELERSREMLKAAPGMADQLTSASSMVEAKSREVERLQVSHLLSLLLLRKFQFWCALIRTI